jgi:hypothetical protein
MKDAASIIERIRTEDQAEADKLRTLLIPQRAGMAVGARVVAEELAGLVRGRIDELRREGTVAVLLEPVTAHGDTPVTATPADQVLGMLHEELMRLVSRIRMRHSEWLEGALRLEGEFHALEQRIRRLDGMAIAVGAQE